MEKITASALVKLIDILAALIVDYLNDPIAKTVFQKKLVNNWGEGWKKLDRAIKIALSGGDKKDALNELSKELFVKLEKLKVDNAYTTKELYMVDFMAKYMKNFSPIVLQKIQKFAGLIDDIELAQLLTPKVSDTDDRTQSLGLKEFVESLVGREGYSLTVDESKAISETNPELYKQYKTLRQEFLDSFKVNLASVVRATFGKLMPYKKCVEVMTDRGYGSMMLKGFVGYIDDTGNWYSIDKELIGPMLSTSFYSHVTMSNDAENNYLGTAYAIDGGTTKYLYTESFTIKMAELKHKKVSGLIDNIGSIRKKWTSHIKKFDPNSKICIGSLVLELIYIFAARIGSEKNKGICYLTVSSVSISPNSAIFKYIGKAGVPTKHKVLSTDASTKYIYDAIVELCATKKNKDYIFSYSKTEGGKLFHVDPNFIRQLFVSFGSPIPNVHKLRTLRGTVLFRELIADLGIPRTKEAALKIYLKIGEKIGALLNHKRGVGTSNERVTGITALMHYVDIEEQLALWQKWGFRAPEFLQKYIKDRE